MNSKICIKLHLIFVTKYRKKILFGELKDECEKILLEQILVLDCECITMRFDKSDHVHLMLKIDQNHSISDIVKRLKQMSSFHLWKMFPELKRYYWKRRVFWSDGYFCSSTGDASSEVVEAYINSQGD